jgi:ABC-type dipeptide/oligopeptide/nickel transport system permease subunit
MTQTAVVVGEPAAEEVAARSQWAQAWERFRRNRLAFVSLVVCAVLGLLAVLAPLIAAHAPEATNLGRILAPAGSPEHLLGTDPAGRDVFSRLLHSLRTAFVVALASKAISLLFAVPIGVLAGYLGGRVDQLLMAATDVMFAFPAYLFTIILVTVFGRGLFAISLAIGIASWVVLARLVRSQVIALKVREYVEAGRAMGAGGTTIAVRYILPNSLGPVLVWFSFGIPAAITAEAGLALLGLGVEPPNPSWGSMIAEGSKYALSAPHLLIWPTALFAVTVLAFTWVGDGLRDAFDVAEEAR